MHPGNVMCNKKGNICLIDLGWAVHKDDQPYKGHPTGERSFKVLKEIQDQSVEDYLLVIRACKRSFFCMHSLAGTLQL